MIFEWFVLDDTFIIEMVSDDFGVDFLSKSPYITGKEFGGWYETRDGYKNRTDISICLCSGHWMFTFWVNVHFWMCWESTRFMSWWYGFGIFIFVKDNVSISVKIDDFGDGIVLRFDFCVKYWGFARFYGIFEMGEWC